MLVLSRKQGTSIVIGNVTVTIKQIRNGIVRVGIEAPKEVNIRRGELPEQGKAA